MFIPGIDALLRDQENMKSFTRRNIEQMQLDKLNELLHREHERGGFYKNLPLAMESLSEMKKLPFTTRRDVAQNPGAFMLCSQKDILRIITQDTSGTSGEALRISYTENDLKNTVRLFMAGLGELVYPESVTVICMPFSGPYGLGDLISEAIIGLGATPIRAGMNLSFAELNEIITGQKPDTYVGMPVTLLSYLRLYGPGSIKRALVSGDACPESVMMGIEEILGTGLFPHYGSREMALGGAITCKAHDGMHLRENHVIAEIIDRDGHVLPEGEFGELVITTIGMEAMPLIRYRTGDYTRIISGRCSCGSETLRLDKVRRLEDGGISELDDVLFTIPYLVDYHVAADGEKYYIRAYISDGGNTGSSKRLQDSGADTTTELSGNCEPLNYGSYAENKNTPQMSESTHVDQNLILRSAEGVLNKPVQMDIMTAKAMMRPCYAGKRKIDNQ